MSVTGWKPSPGYKVFKAGGRPVFLDVISPVASWYAHRPNGGKGRPVRCGGTQCALCGDYQKQVRAVVLCLDNAKNEVYVYLTERTRKQFPDGDIAGLRIKIWKGGQGRDNSPLEIEVVGRHDHRIRDIEALCATWDLPPKVIEDHPRLEVVGA